MFTEPKPIHVLTEKCIHTNFISKAVRSSEPGVNTVWSCKEMRVKGHEEAWDEEEEVWNEEEEVWDEEEEVWDEEEEVWDEEEEVWDEEEEVWDQAWDEEEEEVCMG